MPKICHHLVAETAKGMARALYEELSLDNHWHKNSPTEDAFVEFMWPGLIEQARHTLAGMLAGGHPEELKNEILDALVKDASLPRRRNVHQGKLPLLAPL